MTIEEWSYPAGLHPCQNRLCRRLVSALSMFCCVPCAQASAAGFEIDGHSPGCDARAAGREG